MSLMENFKAKIAKSKVRGSNTEAEFDVAYSTGFLSIDYLNGTCIHVDGNDRKFSYDSTGITDGSTNTIIGRSGSGKSTMTMQIAGNIVRPFLAVGMDADIYIDDIEGSLPASRKQFLLDLPLEDFGKHVDIRNFGITTENVYERLNLIHNEKIEHKKEYTYDTGVYDTYGNRIYKMIPTVYVVDSLAMLMPEKLAEEDDLGTNMNGATTAKSNSTIFKKISQLCKEANIIFFTVNHITQQISTGFMPPPAMISGLKQDERLPGGRAALYLANNMFRCDDSLTLKADKDYGIDGSIVNVTLIKSRTNTTKKAVPMIFNKTLGKFDSELSMFHLINSDGGFGGAGVRMYIPGHEDLTFSKKTFKEKLAESPELQEAFAEVAYTTLRKLLSETRNQSAQSTTITDNLRNMFAKFGQHTEEEESE